MTLNMLEYLDSNFKKLKILILFTIMAASATNSPSDTTETNEDILSSDDEYDYITDIEDIEDIDYSSCLDDMSDEETHTKPIVEEQIPKEVPTQVVPVVPIFQDHMLEDENSLMYVTPTERKEIIRRRKKKRYDRKFTFKTKDLYDGIWYDNEYEKSFLEMFSPRYLEVCFGNEMVKEFRNCLDERGKIVKEYKNDDLSEQERKDLRRQLKKRYIKIRDGIYLYKKFINARIFFEVFTKWVDRAMNKGLGYSKFEEYKYYRMAELESKRLGRKYPLSNDERRKFVWLNVGINQTKTSKITVILKI